ncbi:MAG: hypothetical protein Q9224_007704, partial [Gallowayella concinna]
RMNADNYVLSGEKTEKVLKRMEKEGYIVKVRERDGGGEESVDYVVGPRGKAEVGERGVAGCVRKVFGKIGMEREELEKRLVRSLGEVVEVKGRRDEEAEKETQVDGEEEGEAEGDGDAETNRAGGRRRSARGKQSTPKSRAAPRRGRGALVEDEAEGDEDDEEEEEGEEEDEDEEDE